MAQKLASVASPNAGEVIVEALRKITVQVSEAELERAQRLTGQGVTETVRAGLKRLSQLQAQHDLLKLRGTFQFTIDLDELREDRVFPPFGKSDQ